MRCPSLFTFVQPRRMGTATNVRPAGDEIQMKDTGRGADRMGPRISSPASMFEKVLRAFTEGDLHYADVQLDLKRLLTSGAPPEKLLEVLERWELLDPLPDYAREGAGGRSDPECGPCAGSNPGLGAGAPGRRERGAGILVRRPRAHRPRARHCIFRGIGGCPSGA